MAIGGLSVSDAQAVQSRVILLAEDDPINVEIVKHILSQLPDVELVVACDGRAALETALGRRFDLMIFDRNMPHITGDRVIRHIKAAKTLNDSTPIIQFTADADRVTLTGGTNPFADAIVPKPVQAAQLLSVVTHLLAN